MNLEQAIIYLKKVLKWTSFCDAHRPFAKAIRTVITTLEEEETK